jgi:prepilin-type N-terminal cleavage/methylation domain-containing protein
MKISTKSGFSLLEIMIVVTIIGFLAGLGVPSFMRARASTQKTRCIDNLRQLHAAKEQWAVENLANTGDTVFREDIAPYLKRGYPACPSTSVEYTPSPVGTDPTCDLAAIGHVL